MLNDDWYVACVNFAALLNHFLSTGYHIESL